MNKEHLIAFVLLAVALSFFSGFGKMQSDPQALEQFINLPGLNASHPTWKVLSHDLSPGQGHIRLHQSKWLMFFLHWRPLTETAKILTVEYVRNLMLNFWGQAMSFKLLNIDGEMEVCGHKALFTEGTVMDGAVQTRFIVWNCPQTNRQFVADCNINLRRNTPQDFLDLQQEIARTVCCHRDCPPPRPSAVLSHPYRSDRYGIFFYAPLRWRTADYVSADWFPQGMSAQNGSLWTLPTDSQKHLELAWKETDQRPSEELFWNFLQECSSPLTFDNVTTQIGDLNVASLKQARGLWVGEGTYQYRLKRENQEGSMSFRFQGFLWISGRKVYFLLASLAQIKEFWNIPNDLSPSDETFQSFVGEEILPNVPGIPIAAYSSVKAYPQPLSEDPANFLGETNHLDFSHPAFGEVMDRILKPGMTLDQKLEKLFYFVRDGLPFVPSASLTASGVLKAGQAICYTKAMVFVSFCRRLGVPAKLAAAHWAFRADTKPRHHAHGIAKIFVKGRWIYVDTVSNRDSWNVWGIDKSVDFDPPAFSTGHDVVVGPEHYYNLTFEDYPIDDVPEFWLESLRLFLEIERWSR